ncbi:SDR family oxidoreductase [Alphaproteobacteria bacterium]|nr:SDR family oxidoreductase [Alphaproteobacteria bacterium]
MDDKCILVTGSSSGIGRSIVIKLLETGARVIGLARDHSKFKLENKNYLTYNVDLNDFDSLKKIMIKIIRENNQINGLISNAGYGEFGPLENFSIEKINSFIALNLTSHIVITKLLLPHLKKNKSGDIIFMGSEASLSGAKNGSLYCSAKFGLRGFSQSIRHDVSSSNIRVCIINPGMVRTNFFEKLSFTPGDDNSNAINPEEIAKVVLNTLKMEKNTLVEEINISPLKKVIKFF